MKKYEWRQNVKRKGEGEKIQNMKSRVWEEMVRHRWGDTADCDRVWMTGLRAEAGEDAAG
jgi:hypothetical protein